MDKVLISSYNSEPIDLWSATSYIARGNGNIDPVYSENRDGLADEEVNDMGVWITGVCMAILALLGLFLSSRAVDDTIAWSGILLFVFGVAFIYRQIVRNIG